MDQRLGGLDPETGQGVGSVHWTTAVGAAEVDVDLDTGSVEVVRYHAGTYAGRVVNRQMAELQVEGCVAFGVGQSFMEELVFQQGQLANATLADYLLPAVRDVPQLQAREERYAQTFGGHLQPRFWLQGVIAEK